MTLDPSHLNIQNSLQRFQAENPQEGVTQKMVVHKIQSKNRMYYEQNSSIGFKNDQNNQITIKNGKQQQSRYPLFLDKSLENKNHTNIGRQKNQINQKDIKIINQKIQQCTRKQQKSKQINVSLTCSHEGPNKQLYFNCTHLCCQICCLRQIQECLGSFTIPHCGCNGLIRENHQIMNKLNNNQIRRYKKIKKYYYAQQNNIKICPSCKQIQYLSKQKVEDSYLNCSKCKNDYCQKCLLIKHEDDCEMMMNKYFCEKYKYLRCLNQQCNAYIEKTQGCSVVFCWCGTMFCDKCSQLYYPDHKCKAQTIKNQNIVNPQEIKKQQDPMMKDVQRRKKQNLFPQKIFNWIKQKVWKNQWSTFLQMLPVSVLILVLYILIVCILLFLILIYDFLVWVILIPYLVVVKHIYNNLLKYYKALNTFVFIILLPILILILCTHLKYIFLCCFPYISKVYLSYAHLQDIFSLFIGSRPLIFSRRRIHQHQDLILFQFCQCKIGQNCQKCQQVNKYLWFQGNISFFILDEGEKWQTCQN